MRLIRATHFALTQFAVLRPSGFHSVRLCVLPLVDAQARLVGADFCLAVHLRLVDQPYGPVLSLESLFLRSLRMNRPALDSLQREQEANYLESLLVSPKKFV